jgi:hypothetical protein
VVTCSARARTCEYTEVKCPNCGEAHQVQDQRCRMKMVAIEIVRGDGNYGNTQEGPLQTLSARRHCVPEAAEWTETEVELTATRDSIARSVTVDAAADAASNAAANAAAKAGANAAANAVVNTAANAVANAAAENNSEMTASGIAPPMKL